MNEWYALVNDLETGVPPLDETAAARVEKRVRAALPRRKKRRWAAALLAAALVLTACGYAAVTGRFSDWFWNKAENPGSPENSEDLLASMGTVIGQSQTVDGATVTLNGAAWDEENLLLSLTLDSEKLPTGHWTDMETEDSWLRASREQMIESLRETWPDAGETELDAMLDDYWAANSGLNDSSLRYIFNRRTQTHVLQIQTFFSTARGSLDLDLHLENLKFRGFVIQGPFDFSFTVERRTSETVYEGSALLQQEDGLAYQITRVTLTPLRVKLDFHLAEPVTEAELSSRWIFLTIDSLRAGEDVLPFNQSKSSLMLRLDDSGIAESGTLDCGPFHQVIDPAAVDAIELDGWLLDLETFALSPLPA